MDWYEGSIGQAIQCAKMSNSVFVVVIYGADEDEISKKFLEVLNEADISSKLKKANAVCIKIQNGTESCTQFSQIYPVILVPSIYFIDSQSGTNIETTGGSAEKDNLLQSIEKALKYQPINTADTVADSVASPRNERVEQARQVLQSEVVQEASEEDKPSTPTTTLSLEERVERAKRLLADKQAQKAKEETEKSKSQESERREMGKLVAENKKKNEDAEFRKAAEERQKEKEESRLALIKIKEQIAQDRAERSDKFNKEKLEREEKRKDQEMQKLAEEAKKAEQLAIERSSVALIQFKLPNGVSQIHRFDPADTIGGLYNYVIDELTTPYGSNVSLSTTFPSRNLDDVERTSSLRENGLVPSTTILILPKNRGTMSSSSGNGGIFDYIWLLLTPLTALWALLSSFMSGNTETQGAASAGNQNTSRLLDTSDLQNTSRLLNTSNPSSSQSSSAGPSTSSNVRKRKATPSGTSGVRTEGNIARLRSDDSDDEQNTYNGNSTQQM